MAKKIDKLLERAATADLAGLMSMWRSRAPEESAGSPALFRCLGERILAQGEPLLAYDVVTAGPCDVAERHLTTGAGAIYFGLSANVCASVCPKMIGGLGGRCLAVAGCIAAASYWKRIFPAVRDCDHWRATFIVRSQR